MTDPIPAATQTEPPAPPPEPQRSRSQIAQELFGTEFFGEAKPPPPTEEPKPADTETGEEPPPIEEPAEGEQPTEGEQAAPEGAGETPIASFSELVEHYELDPEWAQTLKVPVTVDGTPTETTIGDLIRNYQIASAAEHRLEDAKAIARKESEAWAAKHAAYDQQLQQLGALVQSEEARLAADIAAVDPKLRVEDPAEWAARRAEFDQRQQQITQVKMNALAVHQQNMQARETEVLQRRDQIKAQEATLLLQRLPEWQDERKANAEKQQIAEYALAQGFGQNDLNQLLDHRQVLILRKAMLYDQTRGQVNAAKKKVVAVPKIMRSGAPKAKEQIAKEHLDALHAKLVKSGSPEDALAYTLAKRGVR